MDLSGYVFEALRKDEEFILYRGQSKDVASQVLVLLPMAEYPRAESLKRLEHEYSLREELDPTWVARPIAMARHWDRTVLVLEDPGGVPLDQLLGHPSDLVFSLRLAVALSSAIDQLHQRDIIHKDIKPASLRQLRNATKQRRALRAIFDAALQNGRLSTVSTNSRLATTTRQIGYWDRQVLRHQ